MKVLIVSSIIACFLSLPLSFAFAAQEDDGIEKVITGSAKALSDFPRTRDKQSVLKFYTKDYFGIHNGELETLQTTDKMLSDLDKQLKLGKPVGMLVEVKDIKVHMFGTIGWATSQYEYKFGEAGNVVQEERGTCTSIHKKVGELWLIDHDHCSSQPMGLGQPPFMRR
jgi:ketosteroid isomerase-like protein